MSDLVLIEAIARSAAGTLCLLTCAVLALGARHSLAGRLGALFGFGAFAYIICTSPALADLFGIWHYPLVPLSWMDGVFFWWFCLALFCDQFRFGRSHLVPLIPLLLLMPPHFMSEPPSWIGVATLLKQVINIALILHAVVFAFSRWKDDLVDSRRRFLVVMTVSIGLSSIFLMGLDMLPLEGAAQQAYQTGASIWLVVLSFGFAVWALQARDDMFVEPQADVYRPDPAEVSARIDPADKPLLARLEAAMQAGAYLEPGLTVGSLADQLGTPEHRLRKLINGGLRYRNFSSYINSHRVKDAKEILADPEQARRQILQVALDLGYGSIASFNRAFREATGEAPTSFRRKALTAD
ncbi:helix-turn-helix domain-containing protein [Hyphobacterium sp. HN65]|uniref:Helix-turn-helix domain-containing protein n=1 Tax=Hyphobacterium lacteum TaxID=3116575 RepID=A0ABU7LS97_9PROT|nr:helix-turn-helix domain-containing protein [Hyphobacterium sp. HN65]MEE2526516.1 helix-turn-helix domain-containing protein [Hyphobacterium sp. HN65]